MYVSSYFTPQHILSYNAHNMSILHININEFTIFYILQTSLMRTDGIWSLRLKLVFILSESAVL